MPTVSEWDINENGWKCERINRMPEKSDQQAIQELLNMARVYESRGNFDQARKMRDLADQIRKRVLSMTGDADRKRAGGL